ncbi:MAG: ATP-binding protein [Chlorobi bacterium]|nr:ATP-binding protein [Chlorobiota bacterium]
MITKLEVKKLNGKFDFDFNFYPDINIFTGKNGCGKTTVLKLIWYLVSGNIKQILREINFEYVYFKSDITEAKLEIVGDGNEKIVNGFYNTIGGGINFKKNLVRDVNNGLIFRRDKSGEKSLFFPTFRRIEGGFAINDRKEEVIIHEGQRIVVGRGLDNLNSALTELANRISPNRNNRFIASISTTDIIALLNNKYTEVLEKINKKEIEQSAVILLKTRNSKHNIKILQEIEDLVKKTDAEKSILMKPFTVLSDLIKEIFSDKSIQITKSLTLGETKDAITSDKLSAGEKQMLSFLCYNFFSDNTAIFIDEPELSLHTDWQRILFPTLLEQSTDNQFFVATHSPFIYSQFPDKEHILDIDKGGDK